MTKKGLALIGIMAVIAAIIAIFAIIFFYRHLAVAPSLPILSAPSPSATP